MSRYQSMEGSGTNMIINDDADQDLDNGGIADRPGDYVDVFHTIFGLAGTFLLWLHRPHAFDIKLGNSHATGLSMLGYPGLQDIDPVYCMPTSVTEKMGLRKGFQVLPRRQDDRIGAS
jgi:geranylgeranyl transferase type-2 subunit beta